MRHDTAMAAALVKAGANVAETDLYMLAIDCLRGNRNASVQLNNFMTAVMDDRCLVRELCRDYLERCSADMRGDKLRGEGLVNTASNGHCAVPVASLPDDTGDGLCIRAEKARVGMPDPVSSGRNRLRDNGQKTCAVEANSPLPVSQPAASGEGLISVATPADSRTPKPEAATNVTHLNVAAKIQRQVAVTIMDTLKIDGRSVGDWTIAEALEAGKSKVRDGRILHAVATHAANAPANALVRNVVSVPVLQRIMQESAEFADAV